MKSKIHEHGFKTIITMSKINKKFLTVLTFHFIFGTFNSFAQAPNQPGAGNALSFDGTNDYVNFGNAFTLDNVFSGAGKKFTISSWVYSNSANLNKVILGKIADSNCSADEREIVLEIWPTGVLAFGYYMNDLTVYQHRYSGTTSPFPQNEWTHVVVVYDGTINTNNGLDRVKIFLNGIQQTIVLIAQQGGFPGDIISAPSPFVVGCLVKSTNTPCGSFFFNGKIDEVRIWNRALTQNEIRNNMCQKLIGNEAGLVGYWRFDETAGNTYFDSQTNVAPNNGTGF